MGYFILFVVVFVVVVLIKGKADKKNRGYENDSDWINSETSKNKTVKKIDSIAEKIDEKTAWLEADTKRMQAERARRKAAKEAEKQAKLEFKNRNK